MLVRNRGNPVAANSASFRVILFTFGDERLLLCCSSRIGILGRLILPPVRFVLLLEVGNGLPRRDGRVDVDLEMSRANLIRTLFAIEKIMKPYPLRSISAIFVRLAFPVSKDTQIYRVRLHLIYGIRLFIFTPFLNGFPQKRISLRYSMENVRGQREYIALRIKKKNSTCFHTCPLKIQSRLIIWSV